MLLMLAFVKVSFSEFNTFLIILLFIYPLYYPSYEGVEFERSILISIHCRFLSRRRKPP